MTVTYMWVYILECENGSFYTGITDDMERRYAEHLKGTVASKYTRAFRPVKIAGAWRFQGERGSALRIEYLIRKKGRGFKELIVHEPEDLIACVRDELELDIEIEPVSPGSIMARDTRR